MADLVLFWPLLAGRPAKTHFGRLFSNPGYLQRGDHLDGVEEDRVLDDIPALAEPLGQQQRGVVDPPSDALQPLHSDACYLADQVRN